MINILVSIVIAVLFVAAIVYIVREKSKGKKCIGCPYSESCKKDADKKC